MIEYRSLHMRQSGFTIIELLVVMMVISIFAAPFAYQHIQKFEEDRIAITIAEVNDLFQSAQNYAGKENGEWPSEADNCASAITTMSNSIYLQGFSVRSPFGTNYTTSCTTGNAKRFIVTIDAVNAGNAVLLDADLPASTVTGNIVTVSVPMPSAIPALEHLLPRDGSRPMTGALNMDDNNILNANRIVAETVLLNSIVTKNATCSTNGLVARDNVGNLLSCVSGRWQGPEGSPARMVSYFNASSCPDGWVESNGANGTRDVRGTFIRSLDRGRGLDSGRTLGSYQADRMQPITGSVSLAIEGNMGGIGSTSGAFTTGSTASLPIRAGNHGGSYGRSFIFNSGNQTRTGPETNPKNVALLACQKQP
ncbi:type II secretion system protein [Methylophaga sp.]|uniref:type II secretion system protein n=1 Tax=Methylophaga sp. TaxID=2024840 RepID=UPI0027254155|nr:prepilin-type N-terminal cleavage/methylation domain-containing protein [Methylophaga sp.]MDO8827968.1 prepilin-type N-terminal cleavage/methylation domain-containing protein [Methylophaga sp.]